MSNTYQIYLISDSTGETLDRIFMALKAQFNNFTYELNQYSFTRTENQISTILNKAIDQASNSIRPGSTKAKDLFNLMDSILRPNFNDTEIPSGKVGRYGHGLGMQLTEPPSHAEWDETILETGMVLTLEPSITYGKDNFLMVAEENILVLDKGVEFLSQRCGAKLQKII